jgi:hypothetical protein
LQRAGFACESGVVLGLRKDCEESALRRRITVTGAILCESQFRCAVSRAISSGFVAISWG